MLFIFFKEFGLERHFSMYIRKCMNSFDRSPPGILQVLKTNNRCDMAGEGCSSSDHILNKFKW